MAAMFALRRRSDPILVLVDIGLGLLSGYIAYRLRFGSVVLPTHYIVRYQAMTVALAVGSVAAGRAAGLYRRGALRIGQSNAEAAVESALSVGLAVYVIDAFAFHGDLARSWIGLVTLMQLLFGLGSRATLRRLRRVLVPFGIGLERYAVVGTDRAGRRLAADLTRASGTPFIVTDVLSSDIPPDQLVRHARSNRLDGLILTADTSPGQAGHLAAALSGQGIEVLIAPGLSGLEMRVANIAVLHGVPLLRAVGLAPQRPAVRSSSHRSARGVAILGTRGVPANYGGFETFAEHLALRLVAEGVPVTVYCRRSYATAGSDWHGVRLVTLPTISRKYLETVVHTFLSVCHLVFCTRVANVILCNAANAPFLPMLRIARRRVVVNVDGLEWRRGKWGVVGRGWYRMGEWLSVRFANVLVTDAEEVRTYYRVRHDSDSVMIPYGAGEIPRGMPLPANIGVQKDGYFLYVSRWEAENNPLLVARAHAAAGTSRMLVMLGEATYDSQLADKVRAEAAPSAVFPGAVYGEPYRALQSNARCYIHATEVGGTHPALIEAMGAGNVCLVLDTPENREVAGPDAWYFADEAELAELLNDVDRLDTRTLSRLRAVSRNRAVRDYSWERVTQDYLNLLGVEADVIV